MRRHTDLLIAGLSIAVICAFVLVWRANAQTREILKRAIESDVWTCWTCGEDIALSTRPTREFHFKGECSR